MAGGGWGVGSMGSAIFKWIFRNATGPTFHILLLIH